MSSGSGSYVKVNDDSIVITPIANDIRQDVDDIVQYVRGYADDMKLELDTALDDMAKIVDGYTPEPISIDDDLPTIDRPVFPGPPEFEEYTSCLGETLCTAIYNGIRDGGTGIDPTVYDAIVAREKETRRKNQSDTYQKGLDSVGSNGFNLANGHVADFQKSMLLEFADKDQDSLNNLLIKDFDLATENKRFFLTTGMTLEELMNKVWSETEQRKVEVYGARIEAISKEFDAISTWVTAEIDKLRIRADIAIKNGELGLDSFKAVQELAMSASQAIAGIAAQIIASAIGALNTNLSESFSASASKSEGTSFGASINESHTSEEG